VLYLSIEIQSSYRISKFSSLEEKMFTATDILLVILYIFFGFIFMGIYARSYFPVAHVMAIWKRKNDPKTFRERLTKRSEEEMSEKGVGRMMIFLFGPIVELIFLGLSVIFTIARIWLFFYRGFRWQ
jgi:hypothetical protein